MKEKNSSLKSILIFVISVAILTFFDQLSKIIMVDALKTTKTIPLIKNVLEFYYIENTGTAWGMFGGGRIFFLVLTVIIMAVLVYITYTANNKKIYVNAYYNNTSGFRCCWQFYRQAFSWLCKRFYIFQTYQFSCL